ncbi:hypothetical protein P4O66_009754 [Electrophorus voltai]|uniref:Uncharacterized protein n=1 Tax=Electrophorus voltai TaxID=2609070 RepID=A0AAD8ZCB5_9TELE|nr:hypothetical protein P4O66_009754 [Electrophorus voltai]
MPLSQVAAAVDILGAHWSKLSGLPRADKESQPQDGKRPDIQVLHTKSQSGISTGMLTWLPARGCLSGLGLKKRTRKAFGIRKKEKDADSASVSHVSVTTVQLSKTKTKL